MASLLSDPSQTGVLGTWHLRLYENKPKPPLILFLYDRCVDVTENSTTNKRNIPLRVDAPVQVEFKRENLGERSPFAEVLFSSVNSS